jgi:HaeIII restriction endonuclease
MPKEAKQVKNGKAFEYALLNAFLERLQEKTNVSVVENSPFLNAKNCFEKFNEKEQALYNLNSSFAVNFLIDLEPKLSNGIDSKDVLQLEIVSDKEGQLGDVRDVLIIRSVQKWEIGISAKNNHRAVKHNRLSKELDFGAKWIGIKNSKTYFDEIEPIFSELERMKNEEKGSIWKNVLNKHKRFYMPVLDAFKKELERLNSENPEILPSQLVEYLIGKKDFYKIIKTKKKVEIQAFNIYGSLNLPFKDVKAKAKVTKLKLPDRLIEIVYKNKSQTTLLIVLNEGWQFSCRIHSAATKVEPSLKFDINIVSAPHTLFTNHLLLS